MEKTCRFCDFIGQGRVVAGHERGHKPFEMLNNDGSRKTRLIKERGHRCEVCKLEEWMGKKIPIELDHIDGHPGHNRKENLRLICPNCHAQTKFYKGANAGRHKGTKRQEVMSRYPSYREMKITFKRK